MSRVLLAMFVLGAAWQLPDGARAQCPEESLGAGVQVERCPEFAVLRADLAASDLGVRVSRSAERGQTVEAWASGVEGVSAVVQGGAFAFPSYTPRGLTVGEGEPWSETRDDGALAVLAFDSRGVPVFVDERQVVPSEPWMHSAVSGARLVRDGVVAVAPCEGTQCARGPRTGIGVSEDGRFFVGVVARFMNDLEIAEQLVEHGAHSALRSGEGASSILYTPTQFIIPSSDGSSRPTGAFLGFVDRGSSGMTRLRGVVADASDEDRFLPDAVIRVETLDGREVAMGTPRTEGAYWEFSLPVRDYRITASVDGYRTGCKICQGVAGMDVWCSIFLATGDGAEVCEPPARTLDVGPWPEAMDAGAPDGGGPADAGADAGDGGGGGCSASPASGASAWWFLPFVAVALRRRR